MYVHGYVSLILSGCSAGSFYATEWLLRVFSVVYEESSFKRNIGFNNLHKQSTDIETKTHFAINCNIF